MKLSDVGAGFDVKQTLYRELCVVSYFCLNQRPVCAHAVLADCEHINTGQSDHSFAMDVCDRDPPF